MFGGDGGTRVLWRVGKRLWRLMVVERELVFERE
jgi:hypothetical protein